MKILLIGAGGQLAQDLAAILRAGPQADELVALTHQQLDICDAEKVQSWVEQARTECIINTAAFHRVDLCEDEPEKAFAVNEGGVMNLVHAAQKAKAVLVQFSTDYVFDGTKKSPYTESDEPHPLSVYAQSRLAGERVVQNHCERYLLVRTCGLYGLAGSASKAGNFVEIMLRMAREKKSIRVVNDQVCTPTSTRELAQKLLVLIRNRQQGLFHMTNTGECSWHEFACAIFDLAGVQAEVRTCSTAEYGAKAARPAYSVLDNLAYRTAGFTEFTHWRDALAAYLHVRKSKPA